MSVRRVTLYTRVGCHLCEVVEELLEDVREELPFDLEVVNIDRDESLRARYRTEIPVVLVDGAFAFRYRVEPDALRAALRGAEAS